MKIGILGGGFGIYGYAPAVHQLNHEIITLKKYEPLFLERNELSHLNGQVTFLNNDEEIFERSQALVMARLPSSILTVKSLALEFKGHLFLEKPLGSNIQDHLEINEMLKKRNQPFSVGYLARYMPWFDECLELFQNESFELDINWELTTPRDGWKIDTSSGGGIFSFYGSHFFDLVNESGFSASNIADIIFLDDHFELKIQKESKNFNLKITSSDTNSFKINAHVKNETCLSLNLDSPFGERGKKGSIDPRVELLSKYISHNLSNPNPEQGLVIENLIIEIREFALRWCK